MGDGHQHGGENQWIEGDQRPHRGETRPPKGEPKVLRGEIDQSRGEGRPRGGEIGFRRGERHQIRGQTLNINGLLMFLERQLKKQPTDVPNTQTARPHGANREEILNRTS